MQKLIVGNNIFIFQKEVNDACVNGWRIVPGTLSIALAGATNGHGTVVNPYIASAYAVAVEKPVEAA